MLGRAADPRKPARRSQTARTGVIAGEHDPLRQARRRGPALRRRPVPARRTTIGRGHRVLAELIYLYIIFMSIGEDAMADRATWKSKFCFDGISLVPPTATSAMRLIGPMR